MLNYMNPKCCNLIDILVYIYVTRTKHFSVISAIFVMMSNLKIKQWMSEELFFSQYLANISPPLTSL